MQELTDTALGELDVADLAFLRTAARDFLDGRGASAGLGDFAELDWLGLLVTEDAGGAGWRPVAACIVAEELGRALDGSGWFGSAMAAAALAGAPATTRQRLLEEVLTASVPAAFALHGCPVRVVGRADPTDVGAVLVTVARDGVRLFDDIGGVGRLDADSLDITRSSWWFELSPEHGQLIGAPADARRLHAVARLLVAADAVGALSGALTRLTEYLGSRRAFGAPIASFQAIQHRLVDLLVFETKARAIIARAARAMAAGPDGPAAARLAAVAHAFVAAKTTAAIDECMQLSGGIGFTWEYPLHYELRRATTDAWLVGSARNSRSDMAELAQW